MDRQIVYPGSIPLDTDLLSAQRNAMIALGSLAQMVLGTTVVADGLACTATQPASMSVNVGAGSLAQVGAIDSMAFGSLPALTTDSLVRIGINIASTSFTLAAPQASGQAINYLIEASFLEADAGAVVLPYYNAANPAIPLSGPPNSTGGSSGTAQMTQRLQSVQLIAKPGAAAAAASAGVPSVDAGWVGLYVVNVAYGQQTITAANITVLPTAPFLGWKLPQLSPGTHNLAVFQPATQGLWSVPAGVSAVKVRVWGGGGAGGAGFAGAGGGGAGGGYSEGYYGVSPGQSFSVSVGTGGVGTGPGASGGGSSFGSVATAAGGAAGATGSSGGGGAGAASGGGASGSGLSLPGGAGGDGMVIGGTGGTFIGGQGGGSHGSVGGAPVSGTGQQINGRNGVGPGGGASGGTGSGIGGQGGPGLVLVEW